MAVANARTDARVTRSAKPPRRFPWRGILLHGTLTFFCLLIILPLAWVFLLSIKSIPDAYNGLLWPKHFDFSHYGYVFQAIPTLIQNMLNSIFVTLSTVVLTCFCAVLAGYALVHLKLRGQVIVTGIILATLFFPTKLISLIAIFQIQTQLHLINTLPGLILPYVTLNLATSILIMRGIFQQISPEIVEAARIDGANSWQTFQRIMLPLVSNGIVVLVVVNFVSAWGEYLLAVTLTNDQTVRTMPVVLASAFGGMGAWAWPRIAAVYIMVITPGIIIFAIAQRSYLKGLLEGALKA
ncbi:MAG TPA: carbohydrate ABC transporter permease [Phototrophicaceae bacterium]|nr:carbohydrate ABC transporter permease [Phototrophicaceae bacterium]